MPFDTLDVRRLHAAILFAWVLLAGALQAQADATAADPVTLVGRAEALLGKGEAESAAMLLWQVEDLLAGREQQAVDQAIRASVTTLLTRCDALDAERRLAFTAVAEQQVEVAKAYRLKKWCNAADERLDVAARFDVAATVKERAAIAARRKQLQKSAKPETAARPAAAVAVSALLQRSNTVFVGGGWNAVEGGVEAPQHEGQSADLQEWVCKATHEDHEVVVEVRPTVLGESWNAAISVGQDILPGTNHYSGTRCFLECRPASKAIYLAIWVIDGARVELVGERWGEWKRPVDAWHRLAVRVDGAAVTLSFDSEPGLVYTTSKPVRGKVGLVHGAADSPSCAVRFRDFRIDPLPADRPSDDELRERERNQQQSAIAASVERARELLAQRDGEAAALELRQAMALVARLPAGVLRDNLHGTVAGLLSTADPSMRKREDAAKACVALLSALSDQYRAAGQARAGLRIAKLAAGFDPTGQPSCVQAAEQAIVDWNLAQLTLRQAELLPPPDDGALLREWFAGGSLLDSRGIKWQIEGPSARVEGLVDGSTMWKAAPGKGLAAGTCSCSVRLPAPGVLAGFCFDTVGAHDFAFAGLRRDGDGLVLVVSRWAAGRWQPISAKEIPLDAWRLDAWHELAITVGPAGVRVKAPAYNAEVVVQRLQLGTPNSGLGLMASNSEPNAVAVELRGFRVKTD